MPRQRSYPARKVTNKNWEGFSTVGTALAGSTSALVATFALNNAGIDETHLRTVGTIHVSSDQQAASEVQVGALGIIRVSAAAAAAGVGSIPTPITDFDDDGWLLYVPIMQKLTILDATGFSSDFGVRYPFDTKAKRIVEDGSVLALVIENATATGLLFDIILRSLTMVRGT